MQLAAVADLRSELGFDDMTDINTAIGDAIDAAEVQLSSVLRTAFDYVTVTDTFFVEETERFGRAVKTELLLTRGFLTGPVTSTLINSSPITLSAFDIVQANYQSINGVPGPLPNFLFAPEKGHGIDVTNFYQSTFIQCVYMAGFLADGTTPGQYLLTGTNSVPKWLQNAAKLMARIILADNAVVTEAGIVLDKKSTEQQVRLLLQPKIRYKPLALDPFQDPTYS